MDLLSRDVLYTIAQYLDYHDLISFSKSSYKINRLLCKPNDPIWLYKLEKDYPDWELFDIKFGYIYKPLNLIYKTIYTINKLSIQLGLSYPLVRLNNNIKFLNLKDIPEIPPEIGNLKNLMVLWSKNGILTKIPREIGNLVNLEQLTLSDNELTEIPPHLGNLKNLTKLNLRGNQLTKIPRELGNLINLKELDLESNQLTGIPSNLGNLENLEDLWLDYNRFTEIPLEIMNNPKIRVWLKTDIDIATLLYFKNKYL